MTGPLLPSPPTDNLYKFLAIAGLVLAFGAPVYWTTYSFARADRQIEYEIALLKQISIPGEYLIPTREDTPEAQRFRETARMAIAAQTQEMHAVRERLNLYEQYRIIVNALAIIAEILGILLSLVGFLLWYVRLQRPQDLLLKHQVDAGRQSAVA